MLLNNTDTNRLIENGDSTMSRELFPRRFITNRPWIVGLLCLIVCAGLGAFWGAIAPANAAPAPSAIAQSAEFAGSESCKQCHEVLYTDWQDTRHAHAFSSPIFQRDWTQEGSQSACLECHTTGYQADSGAYAEEGVTCESCHGPFVEGHPSKPMSITPDENLCASCHKNTTDEWRASPHGQKGVQCQACHNPHAQKPMAATVTELCSNCHKERGGSFTHGTHADSGLECSNCHMYTRPRVDDPIGGLIPTGHTFSVGSDACIGCHQDTVHSRDEILKLSGEIPSVSEASVQSLEQTITTQEQEISDLKSTSAVRLYTGLAQGAIVGLITGGVAGWVISRRTRLVEVESHD
jgi:predicted CXXCH cytochrome family protein